MVSFVGAGPGAEDLITIRGKKLLEEADVIIYAGSLVNPKLLQYAGAACDVYNSAKMSLDEVIAVIKEADSKGLAVVRLHTGDPSLYGAIREQMDALNALGITYSVVPGVSSFSGAAAALKAEYTLPGISQSVIITRMEGRTPVPELEKLSLLARHQATMVIFLSASMTDLVAKELIAGGYSEDTPAAIVYKATWPDEKVIRCSIGTLHQSAKDNDINNLALIVVGEFLGSDYELSKLYDSGFSTGVRKASTDETINVSLIAFSDKGISQAENIAKYLETLEGDVSVNIRDIYRCKEGSLGDWTAKHFRCDDALVFVGACGIATRAIAPFITHKTIDPAIIVVDELGQNVIPLLSGHIGGANRLSEIIAEGIQSKAVITTATDINGKWAVDTWAKDNHMTIKNPSFIKNVSGKVLGNEDIVITYHDIDTNALTLIPKVLSVGIGCKKGTDAKVIEEAFISALRDNNLSPEAVEGIYSIDIKANEPGLIEFAMGRGLKLKTFKADELNSLKGDYSGSEFVANTTGVDCVCERSAVLGAAGKSDKALIVRKTAGNGVTIAVAVKDKND